MYKCINCGAKYEALDEIKAPGDAVTCKQCGGRIFIKEVTSTAKRVKTG